MVAEISLEDALNEQGASSRPICVGLDGTVITTRLTWERVGSIFRRSPWLAGALPFWLLSSPAHLKKRVVLDAGTLPYRKPLIAALAQARQKGRRVVLAANADTDEAELVASHLGAFDAVYTGEPAKLGEQLRAAFPDGFDYVGNSRQDSSLLAAAKRGFLVGAPASAVGLTREHAHVSVASRRPSILRALITELRPHQWAKNALVALPVLLAPVPPPMFSFVHAAVAAGTFSLCASAGYVFNDLLDLDADRVHHTKSKRPFASGALPIVFGFPLFVALLLTSFGLALALLPPAFSAMLTLYFIGTMSYSLILKRLLLIDVLVLAGLYTHRILSGGIATSIHVSAWLLGFSMFLFTSLAFAKRFVELHGMTSDEKVKNRGYFREDLPMVTGMGTASGYIAALVFMLYVDSSAVKAAYREPALLWLVLPALLYWLGRIWLLAGRGQMQDDPVKFALKDRKSLACVGLVGLIAMTARFAPDWLSALLH